MKRKIYEKMLEWKQKSAGKTALLIDGARRVGKSWIVEEFGRNEYASCLIIDFAHIPTKVKRIFNEYVNDLDELFLLLSSVYHVNLVRGNSLVVFDEVQRFPKAREAIKYLVKHGRYHYIETGSLISIRKNVQNIVIPSEERHLKMYPMDFEEFVWATGKTGIIPLIEKRFAELKPLGTDMHRQCMDIFRQYMVVGGMPQAVQAFVETGSLSGVDAVKRDILDLYRADIGKFGGRSKHKISDAFDGIPAQLSKHEKRYSLADLEGQTKMRDYDVTFDWLKSSMIVNVAYNATEPNVGLRLNADRRTLKCYMGDTGLLVSHAFDENELATADVHARILSGDIALNEGMLTENVVAQMLCSAGHRLYFYSKSDREHAENRMEIDFLLARSKTERKGNIAPVEVKSGKRYTIVSLNKFRDKFAEYLTTPYVIHGKDLKIEDGVVYLPLYMVPLLVTKNFSKSM